MANKVENYRELITSVKENEQLLDVMKKSLANLLSELDSLEKNADSTIIEKNQEYRDEIQNYQRILYKIEKAMHKDKEDFREHASHKISDFIKWLDLDIKIEDKAVSGVQVDSRLVNKNCVFFAIKGENENGEKYIDDAFKNGASYVFASKTCEKEDDRIIKVDDSLEALKKIAIEYKKSLNAKVLGITGSVGKTTCKNFAYAILNERYRTAKTYGNYNTVTGISMSILDMPKDTEAIILEMGVDKPNEMNELVDIALPDYAIVSNIYESHLEGFGSKEGIFNEKIKIASRMDEDSFLSLNGESEFLSDYQNDKLNLIKVFEDENLYKKFVNTDCDATFIKDVQISSDGTSFTLLHDGAEESFTINLFGKHLAFNAAIVIMVCVRMGVSFDEARKGLLKSEPELMRFDRFIVDGYQIINDAYNSSYDSLMAAIKTSRILSENKLLVMMGDILEIGGDAGAKHRQIGKDLSKLGMDYAIFYGEHMKEAYQSYKGKQAKYFEKIDDAAMYIMNYIEKGDTLLLKASRSLALERVSDLVIMNIMRARFVDMLFELFEEKN